MQRTLEPGLSWSSSSHRPRDVLQNESKVIHQLLQVLLYNYFSRSSPQQFLATLGLLAEKSYCHLRLGRLAQCELTMLESVGVHVPPYALNSKSMAEHNISQDILIVKRDIGG